MSKVAILIGSVRPNRRSVQVAKWLQSQLTQVGGVQYDLIDLKDINLPMMNEPNIPFTGIYTHETTKQWSQLIQGYDGFIFLFPQYNGGYPAVIKNAIDYLAKEWANKPVSLVTFGGHGGNLGQTAMRSVITTLRMKQMSVNLQISIMPDDSTEKADEILHGYDFDANLLGQEFAKKLN
jgi:NAD(P)H-dependent FMN reductase